MLTTASHLRPHLGSPPCTSVSNSSTVACRCSPFCATLLVILTSGGQQYSVGEKFFKAYLEGKFLCFKLEYPGLSFTSGFASLILQWVDSSWIYYEDVLGDKLLKELLRRTVKGYIVRMYVVVRMLQCVTSQPCKSSIFTNLARG